MIVDSIFVVIVNWSLNRGEGNVMNRNTFPQMDAGQLH
jgi:hypothetical protein